MNGPNGHSVAIEIPGRDRTMNNPARSAGVKDAEKEYNPERVE